MKPRIPVFVAVGLLVVATLAMTATHNAQLKAQTEVHNAQLVAQAAGFQKK